MRPTEVNSGTHFLWPIEGIDTRFRAVVIRLIDHALLNFSAATLLSYIQYTWKVQPSVIERCAPVWLHAQSAAVC